MSSTKRQRPNTPPKSTSSTSSTTSTPSPKVKRKSLPSQVFTCTLPPTCNPPQPPTILLSSKEFESHYTTYHTHVCNASEKKTPNARESVCGKVFPDNRLLELHFAECHDPLIAVRRDRGERTFACFLPTCPSKFTTPKGRRLHLIDTHKYPKEYFFSVTTKGVGDLLSRWGQGASLLRKKWKPRANEAMDVASSTASSPSDTRSSQPPTQHADPEPAKDVDALVSSLSSLSLVPPSIRFGRGPKSGALLGRGAKAAPASVSSIAKEHGLPGSKSGPSNSERVLGGGKRPSRGHGRSSLGAVGQATTSVPEVDM
ncbi:hypothetical protein FRB99_000550 [Tulasnella sp. 403]|nr:hypothetical protein FRB99_000550 [Tulasnella sp. 403]